MCSVPARLGLALAAACLLVRAHPCSGQDAPAEEARLVEILDSLVPALHRAQEAADRIERRRQAELRARQAPLDTIRVGAATLVIPAGSEETARSVAGPVWEETWAPWASGAQAAPVWIAFQWSSDLVEIRVPDRTVIAVEGERPWASRGYMEEGFRTAVGGILAGRLRGTRLGAWLDGAPVRPPMEEAAIYRRVATAASAPARACLGGRPDRCAAALSLDLDDTPFDEWYTPEQRRLLVRRNAELWLRRPLAVDETYACLDGDLGACDTALDAFYRRQVGGPGVAGSHPYWGAPLSGPVRASFLWHAVSRGGPDTWLRLLEAADREPGPALEYATGRTSEELVTEWQAWLRGHRPAREAAAGAAVPALAWAALFLALALRSTRWRLG